MLKLVALDIDGTLLNGEGIITERTKQAIGMLRLQGTEVTLCTGRNLPLALPYARELRITMPLVTCNGAEIRQLNESVLDRRSLSPELTRQVYEILHKYDALYDIYADDRIVIASKSDHEERLIAYYRYVKGSESGYEALLRDELNQPYMYEAHSIQEWLETGKTNVQKFFVSEHRRQQLMVICEELRGLEGISVTTSHLTNLEITHLSADKGGALARITETYGWQSNEVAVIGDGMNDVSMFLYAGMSVAMGNASEELKRYATFVTGSNKEEGIAQALESWII
ncbi:HAD family phosphatase [Paenibacillus sp. SYP-B3998]|uniref:HAD family phosphatase n=1 Tax=Paenibacillus sp. SYP-B3998 TaxID=2678564 RepID=A0A6G3ZT94_9BACL|nr:Cof-type HAD-IIB family hydrolase [Paenibacillus sp. SYP-B3998]NEW04924.1 HAD family phosphatase [Paenibacillus sp. SYP-B3998]